MIARAIVPNEPSCQLAESSFETREHFASLTDLMPSNARHELRHLTDGDGGFRRYLSMGLGTAKH